MNIVRCISGAKREGKTTELLELCIDMMRFERTKPKLYIITIEESAESILELLTVILEQQGYSEEGISDILKNNLGRIIEINPSSDVDVLYRKLDEIVSTNDCKVFIDMPELLDKKFSSHINAFVDLYPNDSVDNSIDIHWTRLRRLS